MNKLIYKLAGSDYEVHNVPGQFDLNSNTGMSLTDTIQPSYKWYNVWAYYSSIEHFFQI